MLLRRFACVVPRALTQTGVSLLAVAFFYQPSHALDRKILSHASTSGCIQPYRNKHKIKPAPKAPGEKPDRVKPPPNTGFPGRGLPGVGKTQKPPPKRRCPPRTPRPHFIPINEIYLWNQVSVVVQQNNDRQEHRLYPQISDTPSKGTGKMNWGNWDYNKLPCDYGEKFIHAVAKTCRSADDCVMLPVTWDCCGSVYVTGVNKKESKRYLQLNTKCRPVLKWCSCPPRHIHAEDTRTTKNLNAIQLGCIQGMCTTFIP